MTTIIKFQALSGADDKSAPCFHLQLDEFHFLLDCGWDEHFNEDIIADLQRLAPKIDAVLLTYPDMLHLGTLPYLVGKLGLDCPIYATIPIYKMGQLFMYDLYQSKYNMEDFDLFNLDDIDLAFEKITQLKYNQNLALKGKGLGITITPMVAGHMIGGTAWKITKENEEEIIYAVDYNHKKERHLNSCDFDRITRPSVFITDAYNASYQQEKRRTRDEILMTNILKTLRCNGNVLVAVDSAGRMLELVHMLDQLWRNKDSGLNSYSLAVLSNVSFNVIDFAKYQVEWMSEKLIKCFENTRTNPFQLKHARLCHNMSEINRVPSPKVVLASMPDLECGYSRELFLQWGSNANNTIIITSRSTSRTLASKLLEMTDSDKSLEVEVKKRVRLEGAELKEYEKKTKVSKEEKEHNPLIELSSDSEDESVMKAVDGKHDFKLKSCGKQECELFETSKKHYPMFPFVEDTTKYDDYGAYINPDDFKKIAVIYDDEEEDVEGGMDANGEEEGGSSGVTLEIPSKCVSFLGTITVAASVHFIDFEGRSDGESIRKIIASMKPKRLVLVRGSEESVRALTSYVSRFAERESEVYVPKLKEMLDITIETHIFQVRLSDSLTTALNFKKCKNAEVTWLDARIVSKESRRDLKLEYKKEKAAGKLKREGLKNEKDSKKEKKIKIERPAAVEEDKDEILYLEAVTGKKNKSHKAALLNEFKIAEFKRILAKNNIDAEIIDGILFCDHRTLAIKKGEGEKLIFQGCLSENYYRIRQLFYDQFAIV